MRLTVVSSKRCWRAADGSLLTVGGFPRQMHALARLFDATELVLPLEPGAPPAAAEPLAGTGIEVRALPPVPGHGWTRKAALLYWLPRCGPRLLGLLRRAEAVHTPVPGDLGTLALLAARALRKPLLVRHCGTWGTRRTAADRLLALLLPRIAGDRTVVLATGWGTAPPAPGVGWIFSTSLGETELATLPPAPPWDGREPLEMVSVGRLSVGKNVAAAIAALPSILSTVDGRLTVIGEGSERGALEALRDRLGLGDRVVFTGNLAHREVLARLGHSHLLLFPSRVAEGFPKAVLEALACGLPVVATGASAIPWLLETDTSAPCGRVLDGTDADAVAAAVLDLSRQPERLAAMGRRAAARARNFTLERWSGEIGRRIAAAWPDYRPPAGRSESPPIPSRPEPTR